MKPEENWIRDYNDYKPQPVKYIKAVDNPIFQESEFDIMMHHLYKEINKMQEHILMEVLRQILGREPVIEDARLLSIIRYPGDLMDYTLAYNGTEIGRVVFENNIEDRVTWAVTFKPKYPK